MISILILIQQGQRLNKSKKNGNEKQLKLNKLKQTSTAQWTSTRRLKGKSNEIKSLTTCLTTRSIGIKCWPWRRDAIQ